MLVLHLPGASLPLFAPNGISMLVLMQAATQDGRELRDICSSLFPRLLHSSISRKEPVSSTRENLMGTWLM